MCVVGVQVGRAGVVDGRQQDPNSIDCEEDELQEQAEPGPCNGQQDTYRSWSAQGAGSTGKLRELTHGKDKHPRNRHQGDVGKHQTSVLGMGEVVWGEWVDRLLEGGNGRPRGLCHAHAHVHALIVAVGCCEGQRQTEQQSTCESAEGERGSVHR